MKKTSAALLPFRHVAGALEVFLVHPGGPFWTSRDEGAWSLAKGEYGPEEEPLVAARREFTEETGFVAEGDFLDLGSVRQLGGKIVCAWAFRSDVDPAAAQSNTFTMEWPRKSGKLERFPEVDRAGWFPLDAARRKLLPAQTPFLDTLRRLVGGEAEAEHGEMTTCPPSR